MGPLFSKEELSKGKITFEVPLQSLGVKTKEYAAVHEACKALTKLDTTFNYTDETGQKRTKTSVIFTDVDVPTYTTTTGQERRSGIIKIDMNASVADLVFNKSGAYVEHLGGIVKLCRSPRTPRLYIYLSAWKKARMCTLGYEALKEFLGVLVYTKDRTKVLQDKCSTWAVFHRDVLKPAQREMEKLAKRGEIEFTFDMSRYITMVRREVIQTACVLFLILLFLMPMFTKKFIRLLLIPVILQMSSKRSGTSLCS